MSNSKEKQLIDALFLKYTFFTDSGILDKEAREQYALSLIEEGTDVNTVIYDWRPLQLAVHQYCSMEVIQAIISAGADINACEIFNDSLQDRNDDAEWVSSPPLHIAIAFGYTDIVKTLIDAGADVNIRPKGGNEFSALEALDFYADLEYCPEEEVEEIRNLLIAAGAE